jgi:hypothetical protein
MFELMFWFFAIILSILAVSYFFAGRDAKKGYQGSYRKCDTQRNAKLDVPMHGEKMKCTDEALESWGREGGVYRNPHELRRDYNGYTQYRRK